MTTGNWVELVIVGFVLLVIAVAAWVETSLSTFSRLTLRELLEDRLVRSQEAELEETQKLRSSMLLIEMIGAGVGTALIAHIMVSLDIAYGLVLGIVIASVAHIVLGRIVPRAIVGNRLAGESSVATVTGKVLNTMFAPLIVPVDFTVQRVARTSPRRDELQEYGNGRNGDEQEPSTEGDERSENEIESDEHEMITNVLDLERANAHDIMVPRLDLVAIPMTASIAEAVDVAIQAGHSRIPVYGENIDEIQGVVYAKDLLKYVTEQHEGLTIESVLRPAHFVPESKRVDDLLKELQQSKVHLAVVVDEYGGTAGVVTIEDILEEIVGEIEDEFDKESARIEVIDENELILDGRLLVEDAIDEFDISWDERPSGTIGGLIQRELGRIPKTGDVVDVDGLRLTVLSVERRRIRRVRCERVDRGATETESSDSSIPSAQ